MRSVKEPILRKTTKSQQVKKPSSVTALLSKSKNSPQVQAIEIRYQARSITFIRHDTFWTRKAVFWISYNPRMSSSAQDCN
jgi:hypothetical protein